MLSNGKLPEGMKYAIGRLEKVRAKKTSSEEVMRHVELHRLLMVLILDKDIVYCTCVSLRNDSASLYPEFSGLV